MVLYSPSTGEVIVCTVDIDYKYYRKVPRFMCMYIIMYGPWVTVSRTPSTAVYIVSTSHNRDIIMNKTYIIDLLRGTGLETVQCSHINTFTPRCSLRWLLACIARCIAKRRREQTYSMG